MTRGSDICICLLVEHDLFGKPVTTFPDHALTALPRAHDLDAVAGIERRLRPRRARNDGAVERDRDAALAGVGGFLRQQRFEGFWRGERLALAVDADLRLRHRAPYSAARADRKRSRPNGRIAGSTTSSRMSRAMASAVTGANKMPLRWWPVA